MGYYYTLSITSFEADDCEACLAEIREAVPDIGDDMRIVDGTIYFEPEESNSKWRSAEDIAIPIIKRHIRTGTTCRVDWQGEDGEMGGDLIGRDQSFGIVYEPLAVTKDGLIPLHEAVAMLARSPVEPPGTGVEPTA